MTTSGVGARWARGFFRAWVAISVLWTALVLAFVIRNLPDETMRAFMVAGGEQQYLSSEVLAKAAEWSSAGDELAANKLLAFATTKQTELNNAKESAVQSGILLAVGIPAVLLALGLLAAWILRGFEKDETK